MSPPTSQDATEVSQILAGMMKPYRVMLVAVLSVAAPAAYKLYEFGQFVEKTAAHEAEQTKNLIALRRMVKDHEKEGHEVHALGDKKIIEILVNDLALLRQIQLETLPKKRRAAVRKDFERQRIQEIHLLAGRK
jgi:hypothetical protein